MGGTYQKPSCLTSLNFRFKGPGVILSRETLRILGPYLSDCLGRIITTHEDVELGRSRTSFCQCL